MMFKQVEYSLKREFIGKGKLIFLEIKKNNPRQPLTMPTGMMQPVQPTFASTKKMEQAPMEFCSIFDRYTAGICFGGKFSAPSAILLQRAVLDFPVDDRGQTGCQIFKRHAVEDRDVRVFAGF